MKMKSLVVACAFPVSMLAASAYAAAPSGAPSLTSKTPSVLPAPGAISTKPVIRALPTLRNNNGYMEIGEEKDLVATLTGPDGAPLAGKTVTFNLHDSKGELAIPLGSAVTNESGRATLTRARVFERPGLKPQVGQYTIRNEFAGDESFGAARGDGSFLLQKGSTSCKIGPTEDGLATAYLTFAKPSYARVNDELPESQVPTFTINGVVTPWRRLPSGRWDDGRGLQGSGPWTVKMVYKGSALYHPCERERKITNRSETTYHGPH